MKQSCDYCRHLFHDDGGLCNTIHHIHLDTDLNIVCDEFERVKPKHKKRK